MATGIDIEGGAHGEGAEALVFANAHGSASLVERVLAARRATEALCTPLALEDYGVQSMADVSPTKWHLAHTTWFFETFVLARASRGRRPFHPQFGYLFNSYYESVGDRVAREQRGLLSRPTVAEVIEYRRTIDGELAELVVTPPDEEIADEEIEAALELGLHHEQQHQELIITDIKHVLGTQPLRPAYREVPSVPWAESVDPLGWVPFDGGLVRIGAEDGTFSFDNERPRHAAYVAPFEFATRPVTVGEYLAFVEDEGYRRPELWLSEGWEYVNRHGLVMPLYWIRDGELEPYRVYTLSGVRAPDAAEPVCHLSYFEADAYARWAGARLPTELEWEIAAAKVPVSGNFVESGLLHPSPAGAGSASHALTQMFGDVWEWTQSAYAPYPGFRWSKGAIGEYNGKFMCGQFVLRGGSCASPRDHLRASYRNFFPPSARWQFAGVRLARSSS